MGKCDSRDYINSNASYEQFTIVFTYIFKLFIKHECFVNIGSQFHSIS